MGKKADVASVAVGLLAITKKLAEKSGDKEIIALLGESEKELNEAMGERKSIGPCFACKKSKMVKAKDYDYEVAKWFLCPHKDIFCPTCLQSGRKAAQEKRKKEREAAKKSKK